MKKIYVVIASILCSFYSCSLDETPIDKLPEGDAYGNPDLVYLNTVIGLYPDIRNIFTRDVFWDICELTTDEAIIPTRQADWDDGGLFRSLYSHTWSPSTSQFRDFWNDCYAAIGKCNQSLYVLENIRANNPEAAVETSIAEVRALRALYYFHLLDLFGRVPLSTSMEVAIGEVKQSDRSELFTFVKNELQEVLPFLAAAPSSGSDATYYGRMTKGVAYFLLAKLALNTQVYTDDNWGSTGSNPAGSTSFTIQGTDVGAWQAVVAYCDSIDAQGFYSLESDFKRNFRVQNEGSSENIFVAPLDPDKYRQGTTLFNQRTLHYTHGNAFGMGTWNGTCATNELMLAYEIGTEQEDPRLDMSFHTGKVVGPDGNYIKHTVEKDEDEDDGEVEIVDFEYIPLAVQLHFEKAGDRERRIGARWKKYETDTQFQEGGAVVHNDYVLFRYADVLLMKAEANLRLGNSSQALSLVNQVRGRVDAILLTEISMDAILKERMIELSWEGTRRTDLIRFGEFTKSIPDRPVSAPFRIVYPIPADVMSSNTNLSQNPGY